MNGGIKKTPDPGVAAVLSFLFSGLGQLYNGQITKGLIIMLFSTIGLVFVVVGAIVIIFSFFYGRLLTESVLVGATLFVIGILTVVGIGIYNIYDAYTVAKNKQEG